MGALKPRDIDRLIAKKGRHADGGGLYFRSIGENRAYWVYRYWTDGREKEMSLGPYPELGLAEARQRHAALRKAVTIDKADPLAARRAKKELGPLPTFGEAADAYVAAHERGWRNAKHAAQWRMTLAVYCKPIRETPVDKIDTAAVLRVLKPIWHEAPETASRLRGRIEAVLAAEQVAGHIDEHRPNPARWKGWLQLKLPAPKKLGKRRKSGDGYEVVARGNHAAMPYADVPAFLARLKETPGAAAKALAFAILTAARSGEVMGATWNEIDLDAATWTLPGARMKGGKAHVVPLSAAALALLQEQAPGKGGYVFPGRRRGASLSNMAFGMLLRRLAPGATAHGFRASFRSWAQNQPAIAYEVAEHCLAHIVGAASERAYQRSDMRERRRSALEGWAAFLTREPAGTNVVEFKLART